MSNVLGEALNPGFELGQNGCLNFNLASLLDNDLLDELSEHCQTLLNQGDVFILALNSLLLNYGLLVLVSVEVSLAEEVFEPREGWY